MPTRIRTRERTGAGKYDQQRSRAAKGPERYVYTVVPASRHIVTTEYHVANACAP